MVPVGDKKELKLGDPPFFNHVGNPQFRRRKVARWVDYVYGATQKGEDKRPKTISDTLGQNLYEISLPQAQQSNIERKLGNGAVNLKQDDRLLAVKQIVYFIAYDPPISLYSSLILSLNKAMNFHRKKTEKLPVFVCRFHGLPSEHLMIDDESPSSAVKEVLSIIILNNSSRRQAILTNTKSKLIKMPQLEKEHGASMSKKLKVSADKMTELRDIHKLLRMMRNISVSRANREVERYNKTLKMVRLNKIQADILKQHIYHVYEENSNEN